MCFILDHGTHSGVYVRRFASALGGFDVISGYGPRKSNKFIAYAERMPIDDDGV